MRAETIRNLLYCHDLFTGKKFKELSADEKRILYICELWKHGKTFDQIDDVISNLIDQILLKQSPDAYILDELQKTFNYTDETVVEKLL
jgi:hypothetical protein